MSTDAPDHQPLAAAIRVVSILSFLSRLAGLVRDLITVRVFGDAPVASAFAAALAVPNTFRRLFGEGALSAAFIPEFTRLTRENPKVAARFASLVVALLVLTTGVLTLLGEIGLAIALMVGKQTDMGRLAIELIMITLPFMPLVCVAAILGGILQVHDRFGPPAASSIILNVFMIVGAALHFVQSNATPERTAVIICIAIVLSGIAQVLWCLWSLKPYIQWTRAFHGAGRSAQRLGARFIPAVVGLGTLQLNSLLDIVIAMWPLWFGPTIFGVDYPLDSASLGILFFSQRLYQFPLGVFGTAVATVVFPLLSKHAAEPEHFLQTLRRGIRLSIFIALPATLGLIMIRKELVTVMYTGGGGYSAEGVVRATLVLLGYSVGIWIYSINHVLVRAFYALGDTRTPARVAFPMVLINLSLNVTLIWTLREAGLAWATTMAALFQMIVLWIILARRLESPVLDAPARASLMRISIATVIMGVGVYLCTSLFPTPRSWMDHFVLLGAQTTVGIAVFMGCARLLRLHELGWLIRLR